MRNVLLLCRTDWFRLAGLPRYSLVYLLILAGFSVSTHVAPIGYIMACYVLSASSRNAVQKKYFPHTIWARLTGSVPVKSPAALLSSKPTTVADRT